MKVLMGVAALALVVGLGAASHVIGSDDELRHGPAVPSTATFHEPEATPPVSYAPFPPEAEDGPAPAPPAPLDPSVPAYTPGPGNEADTTGDQTREAREVRENGDYYDGNYGNDEEWHRTYGDPDEYYDGDYDNDDDYHRKYGGN